MVAKEKKITFALPTTNGTMAEWLGSGLQNRVQQFDSAWYLTKIRSKVSFELDFLLLLTGGYNNHQMGTSDKAAHRLAQ